MPLEPGSGGVYRAVMSASDTPAHASAEDADTARAIREIAERLTAPGGNPVARARAWVEKVIPEAQRGPGWDRHWRELEAYAESAAIWAPEDGVAPHVDAFEDEDEDGDED